MTHIVCPAQLYGMPDPIVCPHLIVTFVIIVLLCCVYCIVHCNIVNLLIPPPHLSKERWLIPVTSYWLVGRTGIIHYPTLLLPRWCLPHWPVRTPRWPIELAWLTGELWYWRSSPTITVIVIVSLLTTCRHMVELWLLAAVRYLAYPQVLPTAVLSWTVGWICVPLTLITIVVVWTTPDDPILYPVARRPDCAGPVVIDCGLTLTVVVYSVDLLAVLLTLWHHCNCYWPIYSALYPWLLCVLTYWLCIPFARTLQVVSQTWPPSSPYGPGIWFPHIVVHWLIPPDMYCWDHCYRLNWRADLVEPPTDRLFVLTFPPSPAHLPPVDPTRPVTFYHLLLFFPCSVTPALPLNVLIPLGRWLLFPIVLPTWLIVVRALVPGPAILTQHARTILWLLPLLTCWCYWLIYLGITYSPTVIIYWHYPWLLLLVDGRHIYLFNYHPFI